MSNTNIDEKLLEGLSQEERDAILQMMKEFSSCGKSKTYEELLYADYKEIPVDIETFLTNDEYLGIAWKDAEHNSKVYPFWMQTLKEIFPTNLTTDYEVLLESGARGIGKAQPLDSLVLAEHGYKRMRDVHYGDKVFGNDGKLHEVVGVFPQGVKNICKITFNDGTSTLCCDEHLWTVYNTSTKTWSTFETKEFLDGSRNLHKDFHRHFNAHRYKIPMTAPVEFEHKDVVIPAYTLGVLLGDGSLTRGRVCFTSFDDDVVNNVKNELAEDLTLNLLSEDKKFYSITKKDKYASVYNKDLNCPIRYSSSYLEYITKNNLNVRAEEKHIPQEYCINDVSTRLSILQGLLDTDGYIIKDGSHINRSTVSKQLAEDVKFIVESLGGVCRIHIKKSSYLNKKTNERVYCRDTYIVYIKLSKNICPFRLTRKKDRLNINAKEPTRYIESVEYVGQDACQCILLDSEEHLYMTNDCIVTHNSEVACGAAGAYLMYRVLCMKNPLEFYHLKPTEKIVFAFMNIKKELAKDICISKFQKTVQLSPWFMKRGRMTTLDGDDYWVPPEPIQIIIGSQADDVIGQPIYFAFFDEISFIRNQDIDKQKEKAKNMIDTAIGGMFTRFIHDGKNPTLLVVASSKRSEQSFMEQYIKLLSETTGEKTYVVDKPVWEVKPKGTYSDKTFKVGLGNKYLASIVINDESNLDYYRQKGYKIIDVPIDFKSKFEQDIERGLCDFAGISSSSLSKYMSGEIVADCIHANFTNPFPDVIESSNAKDDKSQYKQFFNLEAIPSELLGQPLFIHLDMSTSGGSGKNDNSGLAGVWIVGKKPSTDEEEQSGDLSFRLAFATSIKAPKGRQISFEKNRNFIRWLREIGFNIVGVSYDTYQSVDTGQQLDSEGFNCKVISVDRVDKDGVCKPYQYLKNSIYEQRLAMFKCDRLFDEFVDVERNINTGKIDHTPNGHKDILDAVCGATFNASGYAEEYAFKYGENIQDVIELNDKLDIDMNDAFNKAFEESLMSNHWAPRVGKPDEGLQNIKQDNDWSDIII